MKKLTVLWPLLALVAVSCTQEKVDVSRLVKNYAVVTIPAPDLTGITDNGKEVEFRGRRNLSCFSQGSFREAVC